MTKYKINDEVICIGNVGSLWLNHIKGKIINRNKFTGNYLVKFTTYQLELHENQMKLINKKLDVVLIPNGEVVRVNEEIYNQFLEWKIIQWNEEFSCYTAPEKFKNSL